MSCDAGKGIVEYEGSSSDDDSAGSSQRPDDPQHTDARELFRDAPSVFLYEPPPPPTDLLRALGGAPPVDLSEFCTPAITRPNKRRRAFPHVDGNFATCAFIRVGADAVRSQQHLVEEHLSLYGAEGEVLNNACLHVSVTRTFPVRREHFEELRCVAADVADASAPFAIRFGRVWEFSNETRTTTFLGARLAEGEGNVLQMIAALDKGLRSLGFPAFYNPALPHVSLAVAPHRGPDRPREARWSSSREYAPSKSPQMHVKAIVLRIGKVEHEFSLKQKGA